MKLYKENNITPVIVTHDLNLINRLDGHIIMLSDKEKIFDGTNAEFNQSNDKRVLDFLGKE